MNSAVSFWESNREILLKRYPGLLEEIISEGGDILALSDIKIETTPTGNPSLCVKGIHVHSQRDPVREGQRLAETAVGNGPVIVLGFGLGYAAQAAAKLERPVIVVEKYKNLLHRALELMDLNDFLSRKNIIFVLGEAGEGIINALDIAGKLVSVDNTDEKPAPFVIRNRALTSLDEQWYRAVEDRIRTWTMKDDVNMATLKRFGRRWVRNLSRNMSAIRDRPGVSYLAGLAAADNPLPVFLAAAGPSLDKAGPLLHDIYRRCVVVAVDTSLRFFVNNGIQPDFVLTVDPQFWNSRHLDRCVSGRSVLIAESAVYPPALCLPFRDIFLCGSMFPLGAFIEDRVDPKGRLGTGGSVATTAWDFSRSLGAQEIWIAGLDLAFPDLKTHFRGARFEELSNAASNRLNPSETWVVRALRDGFPFKALSASGGQVLTDRRLSLYAAWFENSFREHRVQNGGARNFGLFQDGLAIAGLEPGSIETLLALPERRDEIDHRLETAFSRIETDFNNLEEKRKRAEHYENAVSVLKRGLGNVRDAAEEGEDIARRALKRDLNPSQRSKVVKELDDITQRIANSEVKEVAGFLFPPAENEKDPAVTGDPFRAYLNSSLKLFSSLARAVNFNLKNIG